MAYIISKMFAKMPDTRPNYHNHLLLQYKF
jgi:hypothetical protein